MVDSHWGINLPGFVYVMDGERSSFIILKTRNLSSTPQAANLPGRMAIHCIAQDDFGTAMIGWNDSPRSSSACLTNIEDGVASRSSKPIGHSGSSLPSSDSQLGYQRALLEA